jgi:hypothetical protein
MMRNDKLIPGLILVLIGVAILLSNFGYMHFHWFNIFHLWPIFLVIGGVNLVFANNKSQWATILKIAVVVLGFGLILFGNFGDRYTFWPGHYTFNNNDNFDDNNDDNNDSDSSSVKSSGNGVFNEPYHADVKYARLDISGGATSFNLADTTNQLFYARVKDTYGKYEFNRSKEDSVYVLDFHMKNHQGIEIGDHKDNDATLSLNVNPIWAIEIKAGATALNFDLSKFKVNELKIEGGAASFNVKLGAPLAMTDVDVSTGVSSVDIAIPQNAACSIETESGLSGKHFEGFTKTDDNNYETLGYATAKTKIHIQMKGGLSDFKVTRY